MARSALGVLILAVLFLSLAAAPAMGSSVAELLNFQSLGDLAPVGNFYNGGGLPTTPNYGITFSSNFIGLRSVYMGGSGAFTPDPAQMPAIFVSGANGAMVTGTMNVTNGFSSGIQFFYTAGFSQTVTVWSGVNGTGIVLATISLAPNNGSCTTFPTYCNWSSAGLNFNGTAKSVTFTGTADGIGISAITVGSSTTVIPEPSSIYLFLTGVGAVSLSQVRKFLKL